MPMLGGHNGMGLGGVSGLAMGGMGAMGGMSGLGSNYDLIKSMILE
jgi:hypothetical protein